VRFSFNVPNFGPFADPRLFADLASAVEEAGWDGLLTWDALIGERWRRMETADPWVLLTAAGLATRRIRLGTAVTPLARRRVRKLAKEITTLDRMTGGRMVLGVGVGDPIDDEFAPFGEPTNRKVLAETLDESLEALNLIFSGEPVTYHGQYVTIENIEIIPTPVQRPRVPIWVGGGWPGKASMRRAARWDGAIPIMLPDPSSSPSPDFIRETLGFIHALRAEAGMDDLPFDLVLGGTTKPGAAAVDRVGPLAEAGVTWWDERMPYSPELVDADATRRRIEAGPPRFD
jgi:alkanesulfonate monooxygenase SsuD/methylene tetrahydromethanopterin reductase-like flavin-dependent oxidoreductase (luciferase family)